MTEDYDDEWDGDGWGPQPVGDAHAHEVRLCSRMCDTCIFRPGNPMHLMPGRVAQMVKDARAGEGHIPCHDTLGTDAPAICRGYADKADHGRSLLLRLGRALGWIKEIDPPNKEEQIMRWYTCTLPDCTFETGHRHDFARHMFDVHTEDQEGVDRHEVVRRLLAQHGVEETR